MTPLEDVWTLDDAVKFLREEGQCACVGGSWCCHKKAELSRQLLRGQNMMAVRLRDLRNKVRERSEDA